MVSPNESFVRIVTTVIGIANDCRDDTNGIQIAWSTAGVGVSTVRCHFGMWKNVGWITFVQGQLKIEKWKNEKLDNETHGTLETWNILNFKY